MVYIIIGAVVLGLLVLVFTSRTRILTIYAKYMKVDNQADITGQQLAFAAKEILGYDSLKFALTEGKLSDAYVGGEHKTLLLSKEVAQTASLASVAIVAHELGHAMQDYGHDRLYHLTHIFGRITRFTNKFVLPLLLVGVGFLIFGYQIGVAYGLIFGSAGLFGLHALLKLLTIPMEKNASKRALQFLREHNIVSRSEFGKAKRLLRVASQTYIVALFDGLLITFNKTKRLLSRRK